MINAIAVEYKTKATSRISGKKKISYGKENIRAENAQEKKIPDPLIWLLANDKKMIVFQLRSRIATFLDR